MLRDSEVYLQDILDAAAKILRYTEGMDAKRLASDTKTLDAVVRNLEVIGEAAKNLPEEMRSQPTAIDWKKIAGLRDILIHRYFGVDVDIIWDVIRNRLPLLEGEVRRLLGG